MQSQASGICTIYDFLSFHFRISLKRRQNANFHLFYDKELTGADENGWEFGKAVTVGSVIKQLEKVSGILSIDEVRIFDTDATVVVEKLLLKDDEIPYLQDIRVENRREME